MKESDWKIFKKIKEQAIDQFCKNALEEFNEVISNKESAQNRYLLLYKLVQNRDKKWNCYSIIKVDQRQLCSL